MSGQNGKPRRPRHPEGQADVRKPAKIGGLSIAEWVLAKVFRHKPDGERGGE